MGQSPHWHSMMDTWARRVTTLDTRLNSMNGWATRRLIYLPPPLRCVVLQLHYFALLCKTSLHFERARVLLSLSLFLGVVTFFAFVHALGCSV